MATQLMTPKSSQSASKKRRDATVGEIIAEGRAAPAPTRGAWTLGGLTAALTWASFTPLDWGPLGWVCLVPILLLVRIPRRTKWMYRVLFFTSLGSHVALLQWMRLGHPTMIPAWWALATYLALYLPLFVAATRVAVHRFGVPLVAAVPVVWTGLEYVQAHLMTGFSWYYLAHTQHAWPEIIQISDLVGAYGVSFVVAMTAAAIAGLLPDSLFDRFRLLPEGHTARQKKAVEGVASAGTWQLAATLAVFAAVLSYGFVRRSQAQFQEGPRVALIQGNFTSAVKHEKSQQSQYEIYHKHDQLTAAAVTHQPDLIVWPETMFPWPLGVADKDMTEKDLKRVAPFVNRDYWRKPFVRKRLNATAQRANAALLIGIDRLTADKEHGFRHFNSAQFVSPKRGLGPHYDKVHRVLFGEYIPFKDQLPWLSQLTPYSDRFGIAEGSGPVAISHRGYRFVPLICFEDTVPHLVTRFLRETEKKGEPVDCLVNLTNDGWFHGSSELNQHLITARFRCIETRTPMVRAVNTGISAIIDGDGLVREPEVFIDGDATGESPPRTSIRDEKGRLHKQLNAALVDSVPLDDRRSLYTAGGDWFAIGCAAAVVLLVLARFVPRASKSETGSRKSEEAAPA